MECNRNIIIFIITAFLFLLLTGISDHLSAKVTGPCVNCHTMHNSQDGSAKYMPDEPGAEKVGWNGSSGEIEGGTVDAEPAENLLVTNCVGCHSSVTGETIQEIGPVGGKSRIPIVYNINGPDDTILAGGNFYWVAQGDNSKGHNVYGIANEDTLTEAPGNNGRCGETNGCHFTLASPTNNRDKPGCQGCHFKVFHHTDNNVYRFLMGHDGDNFYVEGVEDPSGNWEQSPSMTNSNKYKGVADFAGVYSRSLDDTHSISSFCGGCHNMFHKAGEITDNYDGGLYSPWKRHPTDIDYPTDGEYGGYDPATEYKNLAPVAWENPGTMTGPVVMCLSCHRPHGSPYPDMLRWNYENDCSAGTQNNSCGCFVCHTEKDGA